MERSLTLRKWISKITTTRYWMNWMMMTKPFPTWPKRGLLLLICTLITKVWFRVSGGQLCRPSRKVWNSLRMITSLSKQTLSRGGSLPALRCRLFTVKRSKRVTPSMSMLEIWKWLRKTAKHPWPAQVRRLSRLCGYWFLLARLVRTSDSYWVWQA